ncbi:hypothetical protein chiPu_0030925, partial [Chiloscyllium punctatum]|nr:hypothetical protein [Chiloscyllium punctatum]
ERVEPERLPAVVESVEQAEVMAVQMKDARDRAAVGQRQHDRPAGLGLKSRGRRRLEIRRAEPLGWRAERQFESGGTPEVELGGHVVARQRRSGRERRRPDRGFVRDDELADRAALLAVVQQDRETGSGRTGRIDEDVGSASRSQYQRTVARREWFGWLAVDRHHPDVEGLQLDRQHAAWAAIDKAESEPGVGRCRDFVRSLAVNRMN